MPAKPTNIPYVKPENPPSQEVRPEGGHHEPDDEKTIHTDGPIHTITGTVTGPLAALLRGIEVLAEGGVISTVAGAISTTATNWFHAIRDLFKKIWTPIWSKMKPLLAASAICGAIYKLYDGFWRMIDCVYNHLVLDPLSGAAICVQLYRLFCGPKDQMLGSIVVLISLLRSAGIFVALEEIFRDVPIIGGITKFIFSILHQEKVEVTPEGPISAFTGMFGAFCKIMSSTLGIPLPPWKDFAKLAGEFNKVFSMGRNLLLLGAGLLTFLPAFFTRWIKSSDADEYIRRGIKDEASSVHTVLVAALAVSELVIRSTPQVDIETARTHALEAYTRFELDFNRTQLAPTVGSEKFKKSIRELIHRTTPPAPRSHEPYVIFVSGPPGIGKSSVLNSILSVFYGDDDVSDKIYYRMTTTTTWDGYIPSKHEVVVYDDFNQKRVEEDLAEFIDVVSVSNMVLPMASISASDAESIGVKGTVFASKIVVCFSNTEQITCTTLHNNDAINRRRHCSLRMDWKTYVNGNPPAKKLDYTHAHFTTSKYSHFKTHAINQGDLNAALECIARTYDEYLEHQATRSDAAPTLRYTGKRRQPKPIHATRKPLADIVNEDLADDRDDTWDPRPAQNMSAMMMRQPPRQKVNPSQTACSVQSSRPDSTADLTQVDPEGGNTVGSTLASLLAGISASVMAVTTIGYVYTNFRAGIHVIFGDYLKRHDTLCKVLGVIATLSAVGLGISSIYSLYKWTTATPESGQTSTPRRPLNTVTVQSCIPDAVFKNNIFYAELRTATMILSHISVIFVEGTTFLTLDHFFHGQDEYYAKDAEIWIYDHTAADLIIKCPFQQERLVTVGESDIALYNVPFHLMSSKRTILHHFTDGKASLKKVPITAYIPHKNGVDSHYTRVNTDDISCHYTVTPGGTPKRYEVRNSIQYIYHSKLGDCGSPIVTETNSEQKIVALHFGSTTAENMAMARAISRGLVDQALLEMKNKVGPTMTSVVSESANYTQITGSDLRRHLDVKGQISIVGVTKHPVHSPTTTDIIPSPIQGLLQDPTTCPAVLSPFDKRMPDTYDFMVAGINKYNHAATPFPPDVEDMAMTSIQEELLACDTRSLRRTLSTHEAINGLPEYPFLDRINMHSSAGFPFCLDPSTRGEKRKLFRFDGEDYHIDSPILATLIAAREEGLSRAQKIDGIPWIDIAKDERRPIKKAIAGKTRTIVSAPLDYVLVSRKLNLPFVAHFYQCRLNTFSAVGINCGSLEWDRLVRHMRQVGDRGFDGDYSMFDGTLSATLGMKIPKLITSFFKDTNLLKREILMHEIFYCLHQCRNFLYMTFGGNSSGGDMTVVINTIVSEAYLRCVWQMVMPPLWKDLSHYRRFCRSAIYGDDNWVVVDLLLSEHYNAEILADELAKHNIGYTTASKETVSSTLKPLNECSFLKRTTRMFNGVFVPIFEETANFETSNWIRQCVDHESATEDNCNAILRNAFFAGSKYYNNIRDLILEARPSYNLLQFGSLYNEFFNRGMISDPTNDFGFTKSYGNQPQLDNHQYLFTDQDLDVLPTMTRPESGPLKKLEDSLNPINLVGDALSLFGLDKPAVSVNPEPVINRHIQYFSPTRNIENIEKLLMDPSAQDLSDREHFATTTSETNIKSLTSRPSYLTTLNWKVSDAAEQILWSTQVGPMTTIEGNATASSPKDCSLLDYISNFATYWRGGVIFIFQIVSSAFHEGRLDITSHPTVQTPPTGYAAGMSQYNSSFVLRNSGNVFKVLVPFESDVPWKRIWRGQKLTDMRGDALKYTDFFTGSLALRVSVPLKATDVVVPNVDINVFIQGAADFELAHPTVWGSSVLPANGVSVRAEAGESDNIETASNAPEAPPEDAIATVSETSSGGGESNGDLDAASAMNENQQGTNLAEQTTISQIDASLGKAHHSAPRAEGHCGEPGWELSSMLSRFNLVATQAWSLTDAVGTRLVNLDVVKDALTADIVSTPFLRFVYFRAKTIKFRIQLTASRFHQGCAIATFVPSQRSKDQCDFPMTHTRAVQIQHGFMNPSSGTVIEITVPFCFYKGYIDLTNNECLGQLQIYVFNQLQAATGGATTVDFKIFMSVLECDFKIPRPGGDTFTTLLQRSNDARFADLKRVAEDKEIWEMVSQAVKKVEAKKSARVRPESGPPSQTAQRATAPATVFLNSLSIHGEQNSMVLCPTRAAVTEPKTKHFADKFSDLRELMKRWTPLQRLACTGSGSFNNNTILAQMPLRQLITKTSAPARLTCLFRNIRGSFNLRIVASHDVEIMPPSRLFAFYVPNSDALSTADQKDFNTQLTEETPFFGTTYAPRAYFDERGACDLQIPYLSHNSTTLLDNSGDTEIEYDNIFLDGYIVIASNGLSPKVTLDFFVAMSDELHIGTFVGCPQYFVTRPNDQCLYPDKWN
jgi:hypothetical protein